MRDLLNILMLIVLAGGAVACQAHRDAGQTGVQDDGPRTDPVPKPGRQEAVLSVQQLGSIQRARMDNGMTVVVAENHAAPVVAIQAWFDVGSADEQAGEEGLAHLQEHMLFKGTRRRGVGEIAKAIEGAGGDINAWTSFDNTVYHVVVASRFFDLGLDVLSDAIQNTTFDPAELEKEKQVVLEEIKRTRDMPGRWIGDLLFASAFRAHPYGHPILGTANTVRAVDRATILSFYKRHYRPDRLTLVVVGDVQARQVWSRVKKMFGDWRAPASVRPARAMESDQRKPRVKLLNDEIQEAHFNLGWHIPDARHPDVPALDVLATLLGQGESSRLNLGLKRGLNLVNDVYAYAYTPKDAGVFLVGAACRGENVEPAMQELSAEITRMARIPIPVTELAKVKTMIESDALYQRETVEGLARRIGHFQTLMDDPNYGDAYLNQVLAVTPEDIMRVAGTYLVPGNLSGVIMIPKAFENRISRQSVKQAFARGVAQAPILVDEERRLDGDVKRIKIKNGPVVIVQQNHHNNLVALRAVFPGGTRLENRDNNGIGYFLSAMLSRGTTSRSAADIAKEVDSLAGSLDGFSGRNSLGMRAEFPSRHVEHGLELFADCLLNSSFPEKEIKRERQLILEEIANREDHLSSLAFDLFAATLFDTHPYKLDILGTRRSVAAIRRDDLLAARDRLLLPERMTISVVGDVEADRVVEQIRALFAGRNPKQNLALPAEPKADKPPQSIRLAIKHRNRAQAHLVLGFMGCTLKSRDRYAIEVLMAILAGQGGRLFTELRDRQSLAYAVTGLSLEGIEPGYLAVYLGVDPKRVGQALSGVLEQLKRIIDKPVGARELKRAQQYLIGTQAISLQKASARAASMAFNELYGLGHLAHTQFVEQISAITREDVQRVARKYMNLSAYTLAIVGPQDQMPDLGEQAAP